MKVHEIGEFGLISRLTSSSLSKNTDLVRGVGDDTAVFRCGGDRLLLWTMDAQIEGVHFTQDGFTPEQIGRRAAAVNLSDIAAMGGHPLFALISLGVPKETPVDFLERIYQGLRLEFERFDVEIIGGNTAELPERLFLDVSLIGEVSEKRLLRRDTARPGDALCVTGELGRAAAGLLLHGSPDLLEDRELSQRARAAHCVPKARLREGEVLGSSGEVTSCIDISDGVLGDAKHIAEQSKVAVEIKIEDLPVAREAMLVSERIGKDCRIFSLTGGEDFELMFTLKPEAVSRVFPALEDATGAAPRVIGKIREGQGEVRVLERGSEMCLSVDGFRHFVNFEKK